MAFSKLITIRVQGLAKPTPRFAKPRRTIEACAMEKM
jgi:hypothetical protein